MRFAAFRYLPILMLLGTPAIAERSFEFDAAAESGWHFGHTAYRLEQVVQLSPDGVAVPLEKLLDAIDEDTLLVPISSVLFRSCCITEAKAIVDKAHAVGAMVLLDVYHSVGIVPLDVRHIGVDFAAGGCRTRLVYYHPDCC